MADVYIIMENDFPFEAYEDKEEAMDRMLHLRTEEIPEGCPRVYYHLFSLKLEVKSNAKKSENT